MVANTYRYVKALSFPVFVGWLAFALNASSTAQEDPNDSSSEDVLFKLILSANAGEYRKEARKLKAMNHKYPRMVALKSWMNISQSNFSEADSLSAQAMEASPQDEIVLFCRIHVLTHHGKTAESIELARRALETHPSASMVHAVLAESLMYDGKFNQSLEAIDKSLSIDKSNAFAWFIKASIVGSFMKDAEVLRALDRALELNNTFLVALEAKGYHLMALSKFDEAFEVAGQIIQEFPEHQLGYSLRANCHMTNAYPDGDELNREALKNALADHEKAIELAPESWFAHKALGDTYHTAKDYEAALLASSKAVDLHPRPLTSRLSKAAALARLGQTDAALQLCDLVEEDYPNHFRPAYMRGYVYYWSQDESSAASEFELAARKFDGYPMLYLSQAMVGSNENIQLVKINKAIEMAPHFSHFYHFRSYVYEMMNKPELARKDTEHAELLEQGK